jgi:hypothetical protein
VFRGIRGDSGFLLPDFITTSAVITSNHIKNLQLYSTHNGVS